MSITYTCNFCGETIDRDAPFVTLNGNPVPALELKEIIDPGDAIVQVSATAICGADLFPFHGFTPGFAGGFLSSFAGDFVAMGVLVGSGTIP